MFFTQLGRVAAGLAFVIFVSACAVNEPSSPLEPRVIVLESVKSVEGVKGVESVEISEDGAGVFVTWKCEDFSDRGPTLLEIGIFSDPELSADGFVLYDGGNTGTAASYQRQGLNRRWNWESRGASYAFIVKPDNTGLYYDFSLVPDGETTGAKEIYKCYK